MACLPTGKKYDDDDKEWEAYWDWVVSKKKNKKSKKIKNSEISTRTRKIKRIVPTIRRRIK